MLYLTNVSPEPRSLRLPEEAGKTYVLHPVQAASVGPVVRGAGFAAGVFTVPGRTAAVFELPQDGAQGEGPVCNTR